MSEDVGVKAPVTRLRRRLSIEIEDAKSPAGTTTPTKKKGGRLATKPQLDLIVENDVEPVPKRSTRKTVAKDIVEPVDDKPMTPSRRSARIRSNTSLVSETTQSLDSPRAKRAARRTSQAGSDNDAPVTPARQTRRTRKDSTSSIDKQVEKSTNKASGTPEVIVEVQETNNDASSSRDHSISTSPKGRGRKGKKKSISPSVNDKDDIENDKDIEENINLDTSNKKDKQEVTEDSSQSVATKSIDSNKNNETGSKNQNNDNTEPSDIVTEYLDEKPRKRNSILHKSTSAIEDSKSFKSKRHRTKSGSTLLKVDADTSNECNFFSDNEIYKKKKKDKSSSFSNSKSVLSDNEISTNKNNKSLTKLSKISKGNEAQTMDTNIEVKGELINDITAGSENSSENMEANDKSIVINNESANNSFTKTGWKKNIINQIENMIDSTAKTDPISQITCFNKEPSKDIKPVIIIEEDSDSNVGNHDSVHPVAQLDSEDQCVPVVKHSVHNDDEETPADKSCEPMDIDESIHHSTSMIQPMKNSPRLSQHLETQNQFSVSIEQNNDYCNVTSNKSKRKSLSSSELHNLEKSSNENKSTLILSQIKDTSGSELNVKSPKLENKEQLSKSVNVPDKLKNKETERKKFSLDYSTSTPLQQKSMKKLGVSIDTSLISPKTKPKNKVNSVNKDKSIEKSENSSSEKENELSNDESGDDLDESDDSGEEVTKTQNEIIDDEAEEASEDYQSGDSQDEDEKQYEEENAIVEKGETLDSDEEFSDDTDYEKDSFVVSSDEEDNELLSGSGDDLSLSDNELSMSAKSKKKYNERKIKEQKKASREMYEARHKISNKDVETTKYKKNNRQRLDSSSSETDEEQAFQAKKPNRQRIESSQELSDEQMDESKLDMKKKKRNRLSESICSENGLNENEITVCNESKMETIDPISVAIKHEPKTPQKDTNLSAIVINDNIEEVNIDPNVTVVNPTETFDPLQATMQESGDESEPSEDNQEILDNYNSLLENLNTSSKSNKKHDISFNITKKQKKVKEPIVDQLNLTQTKPKKTKSKAEKSVESQRLSEERHKINDVDNDGEESDSINMHLLFTEDSNDSVPNTDNNKTETVVEASEVKDYIPLKKTEGKTNLLESMDITAEMDTSSNLNESKSKNKTRTSSQYNQVNSSLHGEDNKEGSFFIDTTGTLFDVDKPIDTSKSSSKKKKKRTSVCETSIVEVEELPVDDVEMVVKKTPKKSLNSSEILTIAENITEDDAPSTNTPLSAKKKKKGKISLTTTEEEIDTLNADMDGTDNIENSFFVDTVGTRFDTDEPKNTSSKKKKKRNSTCNSNLVEMDELHFENNETLEKKTPKKSLNSTALELDTEKNTADHDELTISVKTPQSAKKKKKSLLLDESTNKTILQIKDEMAVAVMTPQTGKKKDKSISLDESMNKSTLKEQDQLEATVNTPQSGKKKNKSVLLDESKNKSTVEEQDELAVTLKTPQSAKKKNKSLVLDESINKSTIEVEKDQADFLIISGSGKKKSKADKSLNITQNEQIQEIIDVPSESAKKSDKKRKSSQSNLETQTVIPLQYSKSDDEEEAPLEISYLSDKKGKNKLEIQKSGDITKEISLNTSSNSAKKKKQFVWNVSDTTKETNEINEVNIDQSQEENSSKKRKRKHSATGQETISLENDNEEKYVSDKLNESTTGNQKKKRKLVDNMPEITTLSRDPIEKDTNEISNVEALEQKKVKNKHVVKQQYLGINEKVSETAKVNRNKKRKERDDDIMTNESKILKQDSMNKAQVTRLPSHILNQLEDKPNKYIPRAKKTKVIATTEFQVEETKVKRNKPSCYLEESVYLNDETYVEKNTKKYSIKNPKVLPFIPTASTSDSGFTTNFRINLLPRDTQFVAQATNVVNFKNDFLQQQKIKKFRTFEKYKNQRNVKLSKF